MQLAKMYPEDKSLSQDSLENLGVKEMHIRLRQCNAARNYGEFNEQFQEWILDNEQNYSKKISDIYKVGNHKVKLAYYGMVYTIITYTGCYLKGKNSSPIDISRTKYCELLKLNERLSSKNVRKTIKNAFYSHNYYLAIAECKEARGKSQAPVLTQLEPIFEEIANEIRKRFF